MLRSKTALFYLLKNFETISIEINQSSILLLVRRNYQTKYETNNNKMTFNCHSVVFNRKHPNIISTQIATKSFLSAPVALGKEILWKPPKNTNTSPSLPSNIRFRYCPSAQIDDKSKQTITDANNVSSRPLVILMGWLLAQEKHLEKYRTFWFQRGYDVLSVRTSPLQLLFPSIGGRRNAMKLYEFTANHKPYYDEILIHALSIGGYQLGELVYTLIENIPKDKRAEQIYNSFKGIIIDSCVFAEDAAPGTSKGITKHWLYQPLLQKTIETFLTITKPYTMDRYLMLQSILFENKKCIPGLVLSSKSDNVSSVSKNEKLYNGWKARNAKCDYHCWENSPHVLLYKENPEEYQKKVDEFVSKINISKAKTL